jgi:hypothetical protein
MSATPTRSDVHPTPPNQIMVRCPRCEQPFRLNYSDDEWHRVKSLLTAAERASARRSQAKGHGQTADHHFLSRIAEQMRAAPV